MLLLVVAVLGGLAAGRLRRPTGARGVRLHLRRLPILALGAFGTALSQLLDGDLATLALGASLATLLAFVAANAHVTGVVVIGCGLLLNLVAVVLNNGMPVRGGALVAAGVVGEDELATTSFSGPRHLETPGDRLAVLGDVLPVPLAREVLSFGDLIVVAGAADAVRELARRRQRAWDPTRRQDYRSTMAQLSVVQHWGTAPSTDPDSGSQRATKPDLTAPDTIDLTSAPATPRSRPLIAATHSK
ncbi:MAG: DUF5317 family protein [Acidimicrobiales bacterium]